LNEVEKNQTVFSLCLEALKRFKLYFIIELNLCPNNLII